MPEDHPNVSVVLPTYNEGSTIGSAVKSITNQTYKNFELIVIDDGSTDDTREIVRAKGDDRLCLLTNDSKGGISRALNQGIAVASGKFIARMDGDDTARPERLERQVAGLSANSTAQVSAPWYEVRDCEGRSIGTRHVPRSRSYELDGILEDGIPICHGSTLLRKDAIIQVGGYRGAFDGAEDYDLWLRFADEFGAGWLDIIDEPLYEYRLSADQMASRAKQRCATRCAKRFARGEMGSLEEVKNIVGDVPTESYSNRQQTAMCHHLAGVHLLATGSRGAAIRRLLSALRRQPTSCILWFHLARTVLPDRVEQTFRKLAIRLRNGGKPSFF